METKNAFQVWTQKVTPCHPEPGKPFLVKSKIYYEKEQEDYPPFCKRGKDSC